MFCMEAWHAAMAFDDVSAWLGYVWGMSGGSSYALQVQCICQLADAILMSDIEQAKITIRYCRIAACGLYR